MVNVASTVSSLQTFIFCWYSLLSGDTQGCCRVYSKNFQPIKVVWRIEPLKLMGMYPLCSIRISIVYLSTCPYKNSSNVEVYALYFFPTKYKLFMRIFIESEQGAVFFVPLHVLSSVDCSFSISRRGRSNLEMNDNYYGDAFVSEELRGV